VDALPQMRTSGLHVFTAALRCVPYVMPEHWVGARLMEDLPGEANGSKVLPFLAYTSPFSDDSIANDG